LNNNKRCNLWLKIQRIDKSFKGFDLPISIFESIPVVESRERETGISEDDKLMKLKRVAIEQGQVYIDSTNARYASADDLN
jgi:hypothetical protein